MEAIKTLNALGLLSGSSIQGVDAALISTDGVDVYDYGPCVNVPYDEALRDKIRSVIGRKPESEEELARIAEIEREITEFHARIVKDFIADYDVKIDVIGFEGHTVYNNPAEHYTLQMGDGALLSELTGIKVVNKFHKADILAGGQGGPLEPVYHAAVCSDMGKPIAVVNIAGLSNVTWIGSYGEMMAFDTGPGNAAINDWVRKHAGMDMDYNGKLAITGTVNEQIVASLMRHKYFGKYPPKSADRETFKEKLEHLEGLSLEDGAATVTAFVAESIAYSILMYLPEIPKILLVCGGGAKNPTILRFLRQRLPDMIVKTVSEEGLNSEALGAQSIAFQAVRRLYYLPISFPTTTGVSEPMIGGQISEYVRL